MGDLHNVVPSTRIHSSPVFGADRLRNTLLVLAFEELKNDLEYPTPKMITMEKVLVVEVIDGIQQRTRGDIFQFFKPS